MSMLRDRMIWSDANTYPDKRHVMQYNSPTEIPLIHIRIFPGVISYEEMEPLIAADGAPIAATGKGSWGQLYAAGTQRRF